MANLLGTTVNGALSASGRISVTYDTDRYQFNFLRASGSNWWVTNDSNALGLHVNNVGDRFYFSTGGDFYSDTNGWLSTALAGKLSLSGGTMSGDIIFPNDSSAGLRNAAANAGFRLDDQYGNMYSYNFGGGYYVDATAYYFRSAASANWMTISGGTVTATGDFRAPIFYDSANTGYYLDPNSTSQLNTVYAAALYGSDVYTNGGWFRNHSNNNGIYWNNTGWHLMPENTADFRIHSGNNSESALRIETNGTTRGYVYANSSNEIGFLNNGRSWRLRVYSGGAVESYGDFRAPIFYDSQDTTYYFDGNSTTSLRTKGSWRADSADWDGEYSGKIQYHANHWYFQSGDFWFFRNAGGSNVVRINQGGNISVNGYVGDNSGQTRDKLRVWDGSAYTMGMKSGYNYGHLGTDQYAMSFQMNNENGRGFWWGDNVHSDNEGAASLTTDGRMVIAKSLSIGEGEAVVSPSSTPLYVKGTTSGADVLGVDGINGRLFTVTDDLSGSLFSVNTIAGLPVIEAFADNTVTIGKYGYATTWSTTGFMTVPNSANIYRDLFINGGRGGNFGNRLIIGTDAATYTLNDTNQRPVAYLHGQYPVLTLNHTVTSNTEHGPTIQFTHHTNDKQWVIGSNGSGTRLDIGYSTNTDRNPHNGIGDYNGSTFIRVDNSGNVQLGRGNGRSTWVNDTLYVGASDSGDSHMYFGEDSSNWYGLHWYWDSGYIVYLYGRNAGTDTEIMRYTTNSNAYVEWRRHFHMNNYEINYVSQLHFNSNTRFTNNSANYLNLQIGSDSYGSIQVRDNSNNVKGYLGYFDSSGFGLLNSSGNWGIRLDPGNVGTDIFYAGAVKVKTLSGGARIYGDLFLDDNYGYGIVGVYDSYRYQGIFAMGNAYKLAADGQGTGNLYGLAWTHTNVGGQSKAGLEHQLLVMNYGTTQTAIGTGIWTAGTITTVNHGNSSQWNSAYSWGNHASAGYIAAGSTVSEVAAQSNATRFRSAGDISQAAGNHALQIFADVNNDAFMAFHISNDYAVHFGLDDSTNRLYVGGWSDGTGTKYQMWDSRDFSSTNISNWNTAYGWGNHASAGYQAASTAITTSNIGSQSVSNATTVGGITPIQFFNNMGDSHGTRTSFDASTPSYNFGFRFIQGNTNGPALGGGGQFYSWYLGLGNDYPATGAGSYGMHVAIPRSAVTPYMSVRYNENNSLGSWIKIAAGYADTAGALSSMNISQFTNNSGYITGYTETNTFLGDGGSADTHPGTDRIIFTGQLSLGAAVLGMPSTDNSNAILNINRHPGEYNSQLGFSSNGSMYYRSFSATAINSTQAWRQVWDSGNLTNLNQLTNGPGYITGNQTITLSGDVSGSGTTSIVVTVNNIDGWGFVNTGSNSATDADSINSNGISYYTAGVTNFSGNATDGALYSQRYGDSWQHQIAGDYRSGMIAVRGKNNGTWTSWKTIIDSSTIGSQSVSYATSAGSASSATIASTVTVNSGNSSGAWYPIVWHSGNTLYSSSGVEIYAAGNYIRSQYINTTDNDETTITRFVIKNGDNYHRSATTTVAADVIRGVASGTWSINVTGTAGGETLATVTSRGATTSGSIYVNGDIFMMGTPTTTNQARTIDFTGFDKEGVADFSDRAYIQHTTNTGGHAGSVLVLSSQNDADDGIAFLTNASSQLKHNSNVIWTAGNDGSGSGLDADLIDGVDSSRIVFGDGSSKISGHSNANDWRDSGFYENGGCGSNWPSCTWYNSINVRHSNQGNYHGFQVAMSYYDNNLWFRSYQGSGTFQSWAYAISSQNIGSQSVNYATSAGSATSSTSASYASGLSRYGIIYGNNWNTYNVNGQFIVASAHNFTGTNKPDTAYNYGSTISYYNSGEDHYQIYITENSVNSNGKDRKMYYRSGWNNSWGGWRSVVDVYNSVCYIDAAVTATGDITAFSDARVKENVETLEGALGKTLKLRGVSYTRTDIEDKSKKIGVIAQEILEVVPEVVSQDENGMYAVSYGNITALLIEAIKEQQKQIDELKEIINGLTR